MKENDGFDTKEAIACAKLLHCAGEKHYPVYENDDMLTGLELKGESMNRIKLQPVNYRVVVLPDSIDDKLGEGLIVKAEETKTGDRRKQTMGLLVAVSSCSFDDKPDKPKVGDRVEFSMYAGQFKIEDEVEYRVMRDEDIVGILREDV